MADLLKTGQDIYAWATGSATRRARLRRLRQLRWQHRLRRLRRATIASGAIGLAAMIAGFFIGGIGADGVLATVFAMLATFILLATYPRMVPPSADDLRGTDLDGLTGQTEAWLEAQRPLLPARVQAQIDLIGTGLEQLSLQLPRLDEREPAAMEVRKLLGEHLPALVQSYTHIPAALRGEPSAGSTPDAQLANGLDIVAREIETMTRQIARGELDALATRGRFLESRYIGPGDQDGARSAH